MNITDSETKPAGAFYSQAAAIDAQVRDRANKEKYSEEEIQKAKEFYAIVCAGYENSTCYFNYRANFIAIKVDSPNARDLISLDVERVMAFAGEQENYTMVRTKTAIIFRIK